MVGNPEAILTFHAGYAAGRISSKLNGKTKQFGWLQAPATKLLLRKELRRTPQPIGRPSGAFEFALILSVAIWQKSLFIFRRRSCDQKIVSPRIPFLASIRTEDNEYDHS
jgi:hypothetical protein